MLSKILPYIDLIIFDIKLIESEKHRVFTGMENKQILQNAKRLGKMKNPKVWVRTPIIPNATDDEKNIIAIGKFIKENMPNIERWS